MNNINVKSAWSNAIKALQKRLRPQQFNTWIKPLSINVVDETELNIMVPNQFILNWVNKNFIQEIHDLLIKEGFIDLSIRLCLDETIKEKTALKKIPLKNNVHKNNVIVAKNEVKIRKSNINKDFTFDLFVEGKSNQLGKAAALQVAENRGGAYNPFFIYGGVGLGKTHLMHAIGNHLLNKNPNTNIIYLHSERFVADMVKALQHNSMNEFKKHYRSADVLLIDDIQFFAKKERTQEEFFHTFNELLEGQKQVVLTCDKYPKEISGLEERLKSRFGWGLTVVIEPPELETRVAILKSKSENMNLHLADDVAFFIARRISSNVRELEGALTRVIAHANLTGSTVTVSFVKEALRDLLALHDRLISIENIQKNVADYFNIRVSDLNSKSRIRSITRPRQIAMTLAKELTNHSLPEIGQAFGGRDHTTVLHACKKIAELKESNNRLADDCIKILRILTT